MKKFLVTYHAPVNAIKQTRTMSSEDQARGMEAWKQWAQKVGNKLVDLGSPLINGQQLTPKGDIKDSNKEVAGYSILQAENLQEAEALLKGHPHLSGWNADATIEVHETMALPGM